MSICIACGASKPEDQIMLNEYKEPLCLVCEKEIREEAIEAFADVCSRK